MQEEIVSGKKFRRLIDAATDKWQRISFWSKASDCVMEDEDGNETTVENEIQNIKELIEDNKTTNEDFKKQLLVYNEDSDYYQAFVDGQWKDVVYAGLNDDGYLIKDGQLLYKPHLGGYFVANPGLPEWLYYSGLSYTPKYPSIIGQYKDHFEISTFSQRKSGGSVFSLFPINMENYTSITLDYWLHSPTKHHAYLAFTDSPFCDHYSTINTINSGFSFLNNDLVLTRRTVTISVENVKGNKHLSIALYGEQPDTSMSNISLEIYNIKFNKSE